MNTKHTAFFALLATTILSLPVSAEVTLARVFGDNMVLQRGQRVPVWGWAAPGEKVTVEFAGQRKSARADASGNWKIKLASLKASATPADFVVAGANRVVLTNILVGELWLCSGQSNMEKPIGKQPGQKPVPDFELELATGDSFPLVRLFKVEKTLAATPEKDVKPVNGGWHVCSSNSLETMKFSAAAFFFAREIQRELNVPVGLVESAWGGTRIEPWTPPVGFNSVHNLAAFAAPISQTNKLTNTVPMAIYNAMIAPLAGFAIRGALWYQGESNCMGTPDGALYADKMKALIQGWRAVWGQGNFAFYYVQLAPFLYFTGRDRPRAPSAESLPEIWEAQTAALRVPRTGMIVTTDLVDDVKDIHPRDKQNVGKRLAWVALADTYGRKGIVSSGPMFEAMKVRGKEAVVSFAGTDGGLIARDGASLTWFTVAGADGRFVPANARIVGDTVVVSSPEVPEPKAVRFAWNEGAQSNFFNRAGLPASPFRTDGPFASKSGK